MRSGRLKSVQARDAWIDGYAHHGKHKSPRRHSGPGLSAGGMASPDKRDTQGSEGVMGSLFRHGTSTSAASQTAATVRWMRGPFFASPVTDVPPSHLGAAACPDCPSFSLARPGRYVCYGVLSLSTRAARLPFPKLAYPNSPPSTVLAIRQTPS